MCFYMVREEGIEPSLTESKSAVLPLHNPREKLQQIFNEQSVLYNKRDGLSIQCVVTKQHNKI